MKKEIKKRNIFMCLLLSVVTFGIYYIYWIIMLIKETGYFSKGRIVNSMKVLLTFLTCGLYGFVWVNDVGTDLYYAGKTKKVKIADKSILYVMLLALTVIFEYYFDFPINLNIPIKEGLHCTISITAFPAPLIIACLVQHDLNKLANKK